MPLPTCRLFSRTAQLVVASVLFGIFAPTTYAAPALTSFDFTQPEVVQQWHAEHHIASLKAAPEGLEVMINGPDPYFSGPPQDYPVEIPLWVTLRLKSEAGGSGQLFFYRDHPREEQSVHFPVFPGDWREVRVKLPPLGPGFRFRIDPPGAHGQFLLAAITIMPAVALRAPEWTKASPPRLAGDEASIQSGALRFIQPVVNWGSLPCKSPATPWPLGTIGSRSATC